MMIFKFVVSLLIIKKNTLMTFKVSSLRYGYANIFADSHIELVEMPVIPDGFSRFYFLD